MLTNHITMEGLFTILLFTQLEHDENAGTSYKFSTHARPGDQSKSPPGMFKEELIPNDLGYVKKQIDAYYKI